MAQMSLDWPWESQVLASKGPARIKQLEWNQGHLDILGSRRWKRLTSRPAMPHGLILFYESGHHTSPKLACSEHFIQVTAGASLAAIVPSPNASACSEPSAPARLGNRFQVTPISLRFYGLPQPRVPIFTFAEVLVATHRRQFWLIK